MKQINNTSNSFQKRKTIFKLLIIIFCFSAISLSTSIATLAQEQNDEQDQKTSKNTDDSLGTWAGLLTAIATLATIGVLIWQIRSSDKVAEGGFLLELHKDFFFEPDNIKIIKAIEKNEPILTRKTDPIDQVNLDNYLGMIELLAIFINKKNMNAKTVDDMFGYYIVETWNNSEIQKYVNDVRTTEKNNDYYSGLEDLACKFKDT